MSSAKSVAKELVRLSVTAPLPDPLTCYRLQILLYYAQAWSLVLRDSEIFPDEIECPEEGPVVPAVVAGPLWHIVSPTAFDQEPALDAEDEALFLHHLWLAYMHLSPSGLWGLIQAEPPFIKSMKERHAGGKGLIDMNDLRESFSRRPGIPAPLGAYGQILHERQKEVEVAILSSPPLDVDVIWKHCRSVTPSAGPLGAEKDPEGARRPRPVAMHALQRVHCSGQ
jgi:uncharacterized phage-associated protein